MGNLPVKEDADVCNTHGASLASQNAQCGSFSPFTGPTRSATWKRSAVRRRSHCHRCYDISGRQGRGEFV
jgi:hypothetical protein